MEESTNMTAGTSSASTTPSMTSPSTVSTGFSSCDTRSFTENYNISRDTGSVLSVDVLSRVVWSLFELLKQNIRCTQPNIFDILASSNNIIQSFWQTISTPWQREAQSRSNFTWVTDEKSSNTQLEAQLLLSLQSHQTLPGFPLQNSGPLRSCSQFIPCSHIHCHLLQLMTANTGCLQTDNKGEVIIAY